MLPLVTQIRFVIWLLIGLGIYFGYGYNHSIISQAKLGKLPNGAPVADGVAVADDAKDTVHSTNGH